MKIPFKPSLLLLPLLAGLLCFQSCEKVAEEPQASAPEVAPTPPTEPSAKKLGAILQALSLRNQSQARMSLRQILAVVSQEDSQNSETVSAQSLRQSLATANLTLRNQPELAERIFSALSDQGYVMETDLSTTLSQWTQKLSS